MCGLISERTEEAFLGSSMAFIGRAQLGLGRTGCVAPDRRGVAGED